MNFWIGHTRVINKMISVESQYHMIDAHMMAKVMEVQPPTSMIVGYLLLMNAKTTDCKELTNIICGSKVCKTTNSGKDPGTETHQ